MAPQEPSQGGGGFAELNAAIERTMAGLAGGGTAGPKPLGVPETYYAEVPTAGTTSPTAFLPLPEGAMGPPHAVVPPRYFEGHEFVPVGLSVEDMAELQRKMFDAGLYSPEEAKVARIGVWVEGFGATLNAYTRLLGFANAAGISADEALAQYKQRSEQFGQLPGGGTLTANPADIRAIANTAALRRRGREMDEQELAAFERAYRTTVEAEPELGVAPPDPTVFAEEQVARQDPEGVVDYRILQAQDEWFNAIKSPVGEAG